MYDVVGVGEVLIDFSSYGLGPMGNPGFEMNPGGAPANCLAANARLGGKCAFIGTVGEDFFGCFLKQELSKIGIDTRGVLCVPEATTIDFVSNREDGERDFAFFRSPGADTRLTEKGLEGDWWLQTKILHFGTLSFTDEPSSSTVWKLVNRAKKQGIKISFDPNYRENLWDTPEKARAVMWRGAEQCDILKLSGEEMQLMFESETVRPEEAIKELLKKGISYVFITLGSEGAWFGTQEEQGFCKSFSVKAVDTTGCGDAFVGAMHYLLLYHPEMPIRQKTRFANGTAALCAMGKTGFPSMPEKKQVEEFIERS